ncbi:MAG: hypothetical protein MUF80_00715 [Burkholderiales bacterium]|jgi:hypothetical protein|nr:hypothetical protein [Burkholderiales bacterium]
MRRLAAILALVLGLTLLAAPPVSAAVAAHAENRASGSAAGLTTLIEIDTRLSEEAVRENAGLAYDLASDDAVAARGVGIVPKAGTRVRPAGVPENWRIRPSDSPGGTKYYDPKNRGNHVRVEQGNPNSPYPNSRNPYVREHRDGSYRDAAGNRVDHNDPAGHIPLDQYRGWPQ